MILKFILGCSPHHGRQDERDHRIIYSYRRLWQAILAPFLTIQSSTSLRSWNPIPLTRVISTRIASLICNICFQAKCFSSFLPLFFDLDASDSRDPPGGWASLLKISICCPGLCSSGILFESSDFGLEREIGPDDIYLCQPLLPPSNAINNFAQPSHP